MNRNYNLDILRAWAITSVFLAHSVLSYDPQSVFGFLQFGGTGVDLFFLLSGWLIGNQLFNELNKSSSINIPRFWFRRWMRTLPAYYVVLIITLIQLKMTKDNFNIPIDYFFFLQNYTTELPFFYVSWSLSVEEQFYLLIAPLIYLSRKVEPKTRTALLIFLFIFPSIFRELNFYQNQTQTHVRLDCCIFGIMLAHIKHSYPNLWINKNKFANYILFASILCYVSFYINRLLGKPFPDPEYSTLAFIFGYWVLCADQSKFIFSSKIKSIIYYISTRSYSIYLLHTDTLAITKKYIFTEYFLVHFIVACITTLVISEVLYRFIEIPFLKLRDKISSQRTSKMMIENV